MSQLQRRRRIEGEDGVRLKKHFESVREGIQLVYNRFTKGYKNVATATAAVVSHSVPVSTFQPVWPDLAKFHHFGNNFKVFGQLLKGLLTIWQNIWRLNLHCQIFYAFGQIYILINGQILKNILPVWSHWFQRSFLTLFVCVCPICIPSCFF